MQERKFTLPTPDGKTIYGVKSGNPVGPAIIVVHGLTGHMYEHQFKRLAEVADPNFCTYRFNLYKGTENARKLIDCTLQTHAADLAVVMAEAAKHHQKIFVVGHSYGGPTTMLANCPQITAVSLWDPTYNPAKVQEGFFEDYRPAEDTYIMQGGINYFIGKAMVEHTYTMDAAVCEKLSQQANFPIQVIMAGDGYYIKQGTSYDTYCPYRTCRDVVAGTSHCFYEHDTAAEVANLTLAWFKQWL